MEIAFVLINCDLGCEKAIIDELEHIDYVKEAQGVFGAYDIFIKLESANVENLRDTITWKIRKLNKVRSTLTLMATKKNDG